MKERSKRFGIPAVILLLYAIDKIEDSGAFNYEDCLKWQNARERAGHGES